MVDEEEGKFYNLVEQIKDLCRERRELSLAEVERLALEQEIRPAAILDEIAIAADFDVDLTGGKIRYAPR